MTDHDDDLLHQLAALDPTAAEDPPAVGSSRYDEILERAMSATDVPTLPSDGSRPTDPSSDRPPDRPSAAAIPVGRRAWPARVLVALAAAVVLVVGLVVVDPFDDAAPADAATVVAAAARRTGAQTSFRSTLVREEGGTVERSTAEIDGLDIRVVPDDADRDAFSVVDGVLWTVEDGVVTSEPVPPGQGLAPFAASSEAVVLAALRSDGVRDLGGAEVAGQETNHYRIALDAAGRSALGALTPGELAWFELEYPENATLLDVWVADDLIRRIRVVTDYGDDGDPASTSTAVTTTEFTDFGADITIEPPT